MRLDPVTLLVCHILLTAFVASAMAFYGRRQRTYDGYWHYVAGTAAVATGFTFYILRLHPTLAGASVLGANALFVLGAVLRFDGTRRFLKGRPAHRALYALPLLTLAWFAGFYFLHDSLGARALFLGAAIFPIGFAAARLHLGAAHVSRAAIHSLMALFFLVTGTTLLAHGINVFVRVAPAALPLGIPFLALVLLFDVGTALGVALLNAARLEEELVEANRRCEAIRAEAETACAEVRALEGLVPVCPSCQRLRDDAGYWKRLEEYVTERTGTAFSHGLCRACAIRHYPEVDFSAGGDEAPGRGDALPRT